MSFYPINLNLQGMPVLLVGGGFIAEKKAKMLLQCGARIEVVSPDASPMLRKWAEQNRIRWFKRHFIPRDVKQKSLVIAATDDPLLNKKIFTLCQKRRIWVNVVDVPSLSTFHVPAVVRRGDVVVGISTNGASPALAKFIRQHLEKEIGSEFKSLATLLKRHRSTLLTLPPSKKNKVLKSIINKETIRKIRSSGMKNIEKHIESQLSKR